MLTKIADFIRGFGRILIHGKKKDKIIAWVIIVAIVALCGEIAYNANDPNKSKAIPTSTFVYQLDHDNVSELHISNADGSVSGKLKDPNADYADGIVNFTSSIPERSETFTEKYLSTGEILYDYKKTPAIVSFIASLFSMLLQIAILVIAMAWLIGKAQGDADSMLPFGSDEGEQFGTSVPDVTFDDVAGIPEAIEEVSEIVTFLKDPDVYDKAGAKCPRGILLEGEPGTGKTLLARALAGEAGVNFISASGSDFVKIYVGQGAKRVRELFAKARKAQPAIVFIDEIDAVGGARSMSVNGTDSEQLRTINALLSEMDGFSKDDHIIVMAATNRADTLDPALVRPGRFDRIISIDTPAKEGRIEILKHYAAGHPFAEKVDFEKLAKHTFGFSGAELENAINEAATLAARRALSDGTGKPLITGADLDEGIARTFAGPAMKSKKMSDEEKKQVAYHEAGHAVVQYVLPECDPVQKISIVSRRIPRVGTAMGYVQSYSEQDQYVVTSKEIYADIASLLAGRCSEKKNCGIESAGASNDLEKATKLARDMVDLYAFDQVSDNDIGRLSLRVRTGRSGIDGCSQERLRKIDERVDAILDDAYLLAEKVITENSDKIDAIVAKLLDQETIDADEVKQIMDDATTANNGDATIGTDGHGDLE